MEAKQELNYLRQENGCRIFQPVRGAQIECSSLMVDDDKRLWLNRNGFPQTLIIDLTQCSFQPKLYFGAIGFRCWHAYNTNPQQIRIYLSSSDLSNFVPW